MSWAVGYDANWKRDIGYGVPATCDHPECNELIDRGLSYVCGGEPYGGGNGCGLYFCDKHIYCNGPPQCERCVNEQPPFVAKPDVAEWVNHKLTDESWAQWRADNPEEVSRLHENEHRNI